MRLLQLREQRTLSVYREPVTPLSDHARSLQTSQQARKAGAVSLHLSQTEKPKPRSSPEMLRFSVRARI